MLKRDEPSSEEPPLRPKIRQTQSFMRTVETGRDGPTWAGMSGASKLGCLFRTRRFKGHVDVTVLRKESSTLNTVQHSYWQRALLSGPICVVYFLFLYKWPNVELTSHADIRSRRVELDDRNQGDQVRTGRSDYWGGVVSGFLLRL